MILYKFNILEALKKAGYNTNTIRKEKIFSEGVLQDFRTGKICSPKTLDTLCRLLNKQPGSILRYVPDKAEETEDPEE